MRFSLWIELNDKAKGGVLFLLAFAAIFVIIVLFVNAYQMRKKRKGDT